MHEIRLVQKRAQVDALALAQVGLYVLAYRQNADDIIDAALIDRQAAVLLLTDVSQHLVGRILDIHRRKVDTGREDALNGRLAELERRGDKLAPLLAETAVLGHVLNDVVYLVLGDGYLGVGLHEAGRKVADGRQNCRYRPQNAHKKAQRTGHCQGQSLAVFFSNAFREHFAHEKDHDGHDYRAQSDGAQSPDAGDIDRDDARRGDVHDVCTDKNTADGTVEVIQHFERLKSLGLALFGTDLYSDP